MGGARDILWRQSSVVLTRIVHSSPQIWHFLESIQYTEVHFASFLSDGSTTMAVMNPPEKELEKCTSVRCCAFLWKLFSCHSFSISICTWFLKSSSSQNWYLNWIFAIGSKNQLWNRQKNQVQKSISWTRDFKKNQVQIDWGSLF